MFRNQTRVRNRGSGEGRRGDSGQGKKEERTLAEVRTENKEVEGSESREESGYGKWNDRACRNKVFLNENHGPL